MFEITPFLFPEFYFLEVLVLVIFVKRVPYGWLRRVSEKIYYFPGIHFVQEDQNPDVYEDHQNL